MAVIFVSSSTELQAGFQKRNSLDAVSSASGHQVGKLFSALGEGGWNGFVSLGLAVDAVDLFAVEGRPREPEEVFDLAHVGHYIFDFFVADVQLRGGCDCNDKQSQEEQVILIFRSLIPDYFKKFKIKYLVSLIFDESF